VTIHISCDPIYLRRRFSAETIELCVRWYITYLLSYRNLAAMMAEREIAVPTRRSCAYARRVGKINAYDANSVGTKDHPFAENRLDSFCSRNASVM